MSSPSLLSVKISGVTCLMLFANLSGLVAAEVVLQKVPAITVEQTPNYPENVARYHLGAHIEVAPQHASVVGLQLSSNSQDVNTEEAALLCDDPTTGYPLPTGTTTLLVSFSKIENIDSLCFFNRGTMGNLSIATASARLSPDSPQWHEISQQTIDRDLVNVKIGPSEAKYVRLTFDVKEPGRMAGLGIYATPAVSDFTQPRIHKVNLQDRSDALGLISYNVANVHARSRVLYVSSGDVLSDATRMIDGQPATTFVFAPTDQTPIAIVDLGRVVPLRRISAVYSPRHGKLDFYLLPSLPVTENQQSVLRLDANTMAGLKPVASVAEHGDGQASVDFPVTAGRYIMIKWRPDTQEDAGFSVAEVAAFSGGEPPNLIAANVTSTRREEVSSESDGKDFGDGKDFAEGKDFKEAKEAPAEAPAPAEGPISPLPPPPAFTFVPVVAPVSP